MFPEFHNKQLNGHINVKLLKMPSIIPSDIVVCVIRVRMRNASNQKSSGRQNFGLIKYVIIV